jgi:Replication-relaxation
MVAVTSAAGGRSTADRLAALAGRLTDRDQRLCQLLWEHRVLTTGQLTQLAFPSANAAEHRLTILHRLRLVDRFRPRHTPGSAPYHYVLGPLGATLLAAHANGDPAKLGYRRDRTLALAHSQRLHHLVGVNGFFCALAQHARHHPDMELEQWWSEQRCTTHWGGLVRPDGYGRWREHHRRVDSSWSTTAAPKPPSASPANSAATSSSPRPAASPPRFCCGCPPWPGKPPSAKPWPAPACRSPPPPPTPTTTRPGRSGSRSKPAAPDPRSSTCPAPGNHHHPRPTPPTTTPPSQRPAPPDRTDPIDPAPTEEAG